MSLSIFEYIDWTIDMDPSLRWDDEEGRATHPPVRVTSESECKQ